MEMLIHPKRLKELNEKSDLRGWVAILSRFALIAANTVALAHFWGTGWAVPLFVTQGIQLTCLYAGVHELSHYTVFKTRWLNEVFGRLLAFTVFVCRHFDRQEHLQHHLYTNDLNKDAEIRYGGPYTLVSYLLYLFGISYWYRRLKKILDCAFGPNKWAHLTDEQFALVKKDARQMVLGYALIVVLSIALQSPAALYFWILPMFTMKVFQQIQNVTEHTGMPNEEGIFNSTRTIKTNPVWRWLLWNMPYHTAHHYYPSVPFFRLPTLHKEMVEARGGKQPETIGYLQFQWHMIRKLISENSSQFNGKNVKEY